MEDSILDSTKKVLNLPKDYSAFDQDIMLHVNSVFSTLTQLGIGPVNGFRIEDDSSTWSSYLDNNLKLSNVRTYMFLRVKLLFDPPNNSFAIDAIKEQIKELEWRMNVTREMDEWAEPLPPPDPDDPDAPDWGDIPPIHVDGGDIDD